MIHAVEHCTIIKQVVVGNQTQVEILFDICRIEEGRIKTGENQLRFDFASNNHIQGVIGLGNVNRVADDIKVVDDPVGSRNIPHDVGEDSFQFVQGVEGRHSAFT